MWEVVLSCNSSYVSTRDDYLALRAKLDASEEYLAAARRRKKKILSLLVNAESQLSASQNEVEFLKEKPRVVDSDVRAIRGRLVAAEATLAESLRCTKAADTAMSQ